MVVNYRQQAPLSLTFASPLAKLNSTKMDHELLRCFHSSKVHMHSNLPILPSTMGLLSLHLGLEQLKDRTIKSSTMSQVLCSTIISEFFISFQNKTQRFHWMTLSSLSIYVVFVDPHHGNNDVTSFLFLQLRLMWSS